MTPDEVKEICNYIILATTAFNIFILGVIARRRLLILDVVPNYKGEKREKYGDTLCIAGIILSIASCIIIFIVHKFL